MILQLLVMIVLFFGSFIPLAGLVMPVLTFGVGAYFYGFAFMDYAVERKRFRVKESVRYMRHNAGSVTAIGTVFALSLMIPWGSIVVCSFVSLLSVVAGTVVVEEQLGKENIQKLKDVYELDLIIEQDEKMKEGKFKLEILEKYPEFLDEKE